jgi:hypothetical protein
MDPQGIEQNHYLIDNLFDGSIGSSAHPNPTGCKTSSKNYLLHNFVFLPYHFNSTLFFFIVLCSFVFFLPSTLASQTHDRVSGAEEAQMDWNDLTQNQRQAAS